MRTHDEQKHNIPSLESILEQSNERQFELSDEDKNWLITEDVGREIIIADSSDYRK
jgi:hypothetical protein